MNSTLRELIGYGIDLPDDHIIFDPKRRHDFVFLFDATGCNPNGDPDNDNMPRQDFETRQGIVSGPCLKRKMRDFMARAYGTEQANSSDRMNLYVKHRGLLKEEHRTVANMLKEKGQTKPSTDEAQKAMRDFFWDVRMFGAVLSVGKDDVTETTEMEGLIDGVLAFDETPAPKQDKKTGTTKKEDVLNAGQCVGCVTIPMAETIEEISPGLMSIVRDARVDNPAGTENGGKAISGMPGNVAWMPYGLYRGSGHYSPKLDRDCLVTTEDMAVLWNSLRQMFESTPSAARPAGSIKALGAWVFTHEHPLGNHPVHRLFEGIRIDRTVESQATGLPARSYRDYVVDDQVAMKGIRNGADRQVVTCTRLYFDWED